jgi:hypothetical protein
VRFSSVPVSLSVVLGLSGCSGAAEPETALAEAIGTVSEAIAGGQIDTSDTAVVGLVSLAQGGIGACSGTLIAPNVVLTAHHCVASITTGEQVDCKTSKFGSLKNAQALYVTTKTTFTQLVSDYHSTKQVVVQPNVDGVCGNDVALIVLNDPIDPSEAEPRVARVDVSVAYQEKYYAVGYGQRGDDGESGTRYRRDGLVARCVGAACKSPQIAEPEWAGDTGICQGDSGGPAFDLQNRLVGVASRGAPGCTAPIYAHVFGVGEWLKSAVVQATSEAGLDAPDWATGFPTDPSFHYDVGGVCSQPTDCESNACLNHYCTRACTAEATCPAGYQCGAMGYCEQAPQGNSGAPSDWAAGDELRSTSSCSLSGAKDPTKPIPWFFSTVAVLVCSLRRGLFGSLRRGLFGSR